jgi:hypothetical protein
VDVTVTPGRTLPLESLTVPAIEAVPCANAIEAANSTMKTLARRHRHRLRRLMSNMGGTSERILRI